MIKFIMIVMTAAYSMLFTEYAASQEKQGAMPAATQPGSSGHLVGKNKLIDYIFTDSAGNAVKLSDFLGKWVMVDVWYSGCGACISTNEAMRTVHDSLEKEGVVFLSISVDKNREKWMASITPGTLKSKLNPWAGKYVWSCYI